MFTPSPSPSPHRLRPVVVAFVAALLFTGSASAVESADSAADLLERGLYTEQTVGDLSGAIALYTRILEGAAADRPHLAEAQLRLGVCHLKQGDGAAARAAFETLIRDYPEQDALVAQGRERLADLTPELDLLPIPWTDGEVLEYRVSLPTGRAVGSVFLTAEATTVDGADAWRLSLYRVILTNSKNFGVSRVWIDAETQRPLSSSVRHATLGHADTVYGLDSAAITWPTKEGTVDFDHTVFDNEQSLHLIRTLPLTPGYQTTLHVLPSWVGMTVPAELEATDRETCTVPAGEFNCQTATIVIGDSEQLYWYSTGPERYPLRVDEGGVRIELASIRQSTGDATPFGADDFGFSGSVPKDWMTHEQRVPGRDNMVTFRLLDPTADALTSIEVYRCPDAGCPSVERIARKELAGAEKRFPAYTLRQDSWNEQAIEDRPTIRFVGDFENDGEPWVQYRVYTVTDRLLFESILRVPRERLEALRADFDTIVASLEAE